MGQDFLTPRAIRRGVVLAALGAAAVVPAARPRVYEVDGVSMAPGLVPGDRVTSAWWPFRERLWPPRRFDRWVLVAADGEAAIKRVVGLPGERVALAAGDLVIDGVPVLKDPPVLAELGAVVATDPPAATGSWSMPAREILDEVACDPGKSVVLVPVRDVGFAAVVDVQSAAGGTARGRATVGRTAVTWRLPAGRHAVVAGRLDGHAVAAAWRLPDATPAIPARSCLPPGPPSRWSAAVPWTEADPATAQSPALELSIAPAARATARIERVDLWRDGHHRAAADGGSEWTLATEVFVLGDHPAASRDSRHWGPVPLTALRHRVTAKAAADQ